MWFAFWLLLLRYMKVASVLGFHTSKLEVAVDISFYFPDLHLDELVFLKYFWGKYTHQYIIIEGLL